MERAIQQFRNLGRITLLELLWGVRVPESVAYNLLGPTLILLLLGFARGGANYLYVIVPGLIAMTVATGAMQGIGTYMSFMRAYGTWRTLQASPIPAHLYFAGLVGSRAIRIVLIVGFMLLVAYAVLGYRVQGNVALLSLYVLLGTSVFAALGLSVAYLMSSPQSVSGTLNVLLLPMIFTGNVLFVSRVEWVETLSYAFPLTFLVKLIRGNALGEEFGREGLVAVVVLLGWLVFCSWAALWLAKRRVEEK